MRKVAEGSYGPLTGNRVEALQAALLLQDGTLIRGRGFGSPGSVVGEVVFNTGMVGYTESLTDPSYKGQILCFTYPLIGNYGVPFYDARDELGFPRYFESDRIQVSGALVHELCEGPSHWASVKSLHAWLCEEGIPGLAGLDTRSVTKRLRVHGVMMGAMTVSEGKIDVEQLRESLAAAKAYGEQNFVAGVSVLKPERYGEAKGAPVALIDCGVKYGILRQLLKRHPSVVRVPYNTPVDEVLSYNPRGVVVSNGPGDPKMCVKAVETVGELVGMGMPTLGICLGVQILALSLRGDTFKLKYGHRGQNKPCVDLETGRSYVTSQNHGYAVDPDSLRGTGLKVWFINADDKTVEGLKHEEKPCIAVQFHPEASPGPYDADFVFDAFMKMVEKHR